MTSLYQNQINLILAETYRSSKTLFSLMNKIEGFIQTDKNIIENRIIFEFNDSHFNFKF